MYNRILVATDGSDKAQRATRQALDLARQYGAELHTVYVIETRTGYDNAVADPEIMLQNLRKERKEALTAVGTEGEPDVSVVTSVRGGVPHEELLSSIEDQGIDLVVMGAKGRSAFKTIPLESTTKALLRADQVPVLVVNSSGEYAT